MGIVRSILLEFPSVNDPQKEAIRHTAGPMLVVAGPGSGKTLVLILRTLNLLLLAPCPFQWAASSGSDSGRSAYHSGQVVGFVLRTISLRRRRRTQRGQRMKR